MAECGGKIWISQAILKTENSQDHGTTFAFTMPFGKVEPDLIEEINI
jgi:hypothetical protein